MGNEFHGDRVKTCTVSSTYLSIMYPEIQLTEGQRHWTSVVFVTSPQTAQCKKCYIEFTIWVCFNFLGWVLSGRLQ